MLFLDELPEFTRNVLELLRQPLEDGFVTIARANMTLSFPAKFMLVAAMNPCPCGFYGDCTRECRCTGAIIQRYLGKISGPLLDRIDLHIEIPAVVYKELRGRDDGVSSSQMREQVLAARVIQQKRGFYNAHIPHKHLRELSALDDAGERTLELAVRRLGLSARAHDRILKVARTIADLTAQEKVSAKHVAGSRPVPELGPQLLELSLKIRIDPHTRKRMPVRGISAEEIENVVRTGTSTAASYGRLAKEKVFPCGKSWNGRIYEQKKVRVVYVVEEGVAVTVTAISYYGNWEG